jgi:hypothetical protein
MAHKVRITVRLTLKICFELENLSREHSVWDTQWKAYINHLDTRTLRIH